MGQFFRTQGKDDNSSLKPDGGPHLDERVRAAVGSLGWAAGFDMLNHRPPGGD